MIYDRRLTALEILLLLTICLVLNFNNWSYAMVSDVEPSKIKFVYTQHKFTAFARTNYCCIKL